MVSFQCWDAVIQYIVMAWKYIHQLPNWDDPAHNRTKLLCFRYLAAQCLMVITIVPFTLSELADIRQKWVFLLCWIDGSHLDRSWVVSIFAVLVMYAMLGQSQSCDWFIDAIKWFRHQNWNNKWWLLQSILLFVLSIIVCFPSNTY